MPVKILNQKIAPAELTALCTQYFKTFVKFVADIKRDIIAVGGELHADAEAELIRNGCEQQDIWGANFYPYRKPEERLEYTALINIRPRDDNPAMEIQDKKICAKIKKLAEKYLLAPSEQLAQ